MRILLAQNSLYYPSHGGGDKSNRLLMEALAAQGHECRVIARAARFGEEAHRQLLDDLHARGSEILSSDAGVIVFRQARVEAHTLTTQSNVRAYLAGQLASFAPDVIVTSTDDPAQVMLEIALRDDAAPVVYLARATLALPFGPDCAFPSAAKAAALRHVNAIVGVSRYVADYVRRYGGVNALTMPISLLEHGPYPVLGRLQNPFVTMVNPCAVKGISIFLALADAMPEVVFAAVPTWGTSDADRAELDRRANIRTLAAVDNMDEMLSQTSVLLVPSLWAEARSRIVVEAMLRGVPVLASDIGGIPEAKMDVDYLLPVQPIERYQPRLNERMVPVAIAPEQNITPWRKPLEKLLSDPAHYEELARRSREAALAYASGLSVRPFEDLLENTAREAKKPAPAPLSADRRKLLDLKLRQAERAKHEWFPEARRHDGTRLRLFCFPHAGGGALFFRSWACLLPEGVRVCPVRLPGREGRHREPPFEDMAELVSALYDEIAPYLNLPFALFGHSMGAVVAFELARLLREKGGAQPSMLIASAARAPQFRLGHVPGPEPTDEQLSTELRELAGISEEALQADDFRRVTLPVLRADAGLYRRYVYSAAPPLDCDIRAYGGVDDRNVQEFHLEAWRERTTASFASRIFAGGHFYLQSSRTEFLGALAQDLAAAPYKRS